MSDQHRAFLARLVASSEGVFAVARWLHERGITVEIPGMHLAPTAAEADAYVDSGDLIMVEDGARKVIQVKRLRVNFSGFDDWPFEETFVSNKAAVERHPDVAAYVSLSQNMEAAAIVKAHTRPHWFLKSTLVRNTGNVETNYACPLAYVIWKRMRR